MQVAFDSGSRELPAGVVNKCLPLLPNDTDLKAIKPFQYLRFWFPRQKNGHVWSAKLFLSEEGIV